jgi:hypothetical protein
MISRDMAAELNSDRWQRFLDINPEGQLLQEAQDIAEELMIMMRIYSQQLSVVRDFRRHLTGLHSEELTLVPGGHGDENLVLQKLDKILTRHIARSSTGSPASPEANAGGDDTQPPDSGDVTRSMKEAIRKADVLIEQIYNRRSEIQELEEAALRTCRQVSLSNPQRLPLSSLPSPCLARIMVLSKELQLEGLLSLKQQQASIMEAKAAKLRADETIKQGRAIVAFTIVTIFFVSCRVSASLGPA